MSITWPSAGWLRASGQFLSSLWQQSGGASTAQLDRARLAAPAGRAVPWAQHYAVLRRYYLGNGVYEDLQRAAYSSNLWMPGMAPLRNPAFRAVEFYPSVVWPGPLSDALPIQTDNAALIAPIQQVWQWSNWGSQKQVAARWLALYGDAFIKVVGRTDATGQVRRVYFQLLDPAYVTDFDTDERGFLTYLRIDVPQMERERDGVRQWTFTEVWDKATGTFRRWRTDYTAAIPTPELGEPTETRDLAEFGIDFLPVVHCQFRDIGEPRGLGVFTPVLDKIDEANRMATRLHQMLFRYNRAQWVIRAHARDAQGRPGPAPRLEGRNGASSGFTTTGAMVNGEVAVGDDDIWYLPGESEAQPLVPNIQYDAALKILQDHMAELEDDLPELAYSRLREIADASGVALRYRLTGALDRAREVRGNAEDALVRADQMALSMGQAAGLFPDLGGSFDDGSFAHYFAPREILPLSRKEVAEADQLAADAADKKLAAGWSQRQIWRDYGYSQPQIEAIEQERASVDVVPAEGQ